MHILTSILMFVFGSIVAASEGDYSGIIAIGKFIVFFALLFGVLWLFTKPLLLLIVIALFVVTVVVCLVKWG